MDRVFIPDAREKLEEAIALAGNDEKQDELGAELAVYLRSRADYLRYICKFCPDQGYKEGETWESTMRETASCYEEAWEIVSDLPPTNLSYFTTCINRALFFIEIARRYDHAHGPP